MKIKLSCLVVSDISTENDAPKNTDLSGESPSDSTGQVEADVNNTATILLSYNSNNGNITKISNMPSSPIASSSSNKDELPLNNEQSEESELLSSNLNSESVINSSESIQHEENHVSVCGNETIETPTDQTGEGSGESEKKLDLSKPIAVTTHTEVVINGKKCALMVNPGTGELCAYPLLPPPGKFTFN